jgi:hypothetical protein
MPFLVPIAVGVGEAAADAAVTAGVSAAVDTGASAAVDAGATAATSAAADVGATATTSAATDLGASTASVGAETGTEAGAEGAANIGSDIGENGLGDLGRNFARGLEKGNSLHDHLNPITSDINSNSGSPNGPAPHQVSAEDALAQLVKKTEAAIASIKTQLSTGEHGQPAPVAGEAAQPEHGHIVTVELPPSMSSANGMRV